jgi:hypothetical protein
MHRCRLLLALAATLVAAAAGPAHAATSGATTSFTLDAYDTKGDGYAGPRSSHVLANGTYWVAQVQGNVAYYSQSYYEPTYYTIGNGSNGTGQWSQYCGTWDMQLFRSDHLQGTPSMAGMDSEFIYGRPGNAGICSQYAWPHRWPNFQVNNSGSWRHPATLGLTRPTGPTQDHTYKYPLRGHGVAAQFRLKDLPYVADNSGKLNVSVRPANPGDCFDGAWSQFGFASQEACMSGIGGVWVTATVP